MQPTPASPAETGVEDARFAKFDVVALVEAQPELSLDAGVWGTVLTIYGDQTVEVEFTDRDGAPILTARVQQDHLELVWADQEPLAE